jgi:hypothetical protein
MHTHPYEHTYVNPISTSTSKGLSKAHRHWALVALLYFSIAALLHSIPVHRTERTVVRTKSHTEVLNWWCTKLSRTKSHMEMLTWWSTKLSNSTKTLWQLSITIQETCFTNIASSSPFISSITKTCITCTLHACMCNYTQPYTINTVRTQAQTCFEHTQTHVQAQVANCSS